MKERKAICRDCKHCKGAWCEKRKMPAIATACKWYAKKEEYNDN